jgi:hypothetical protein
MSEFSQLMRITSVFLIFALLIQLTGCYSFKPISESDSSLSQTDKYRYRIHTKDMDFQLEYSMISNGILSGKVDFHNLSRIDVIKIYPSSDFVIKIDSLNMISIPLDSIAKFEKSKFSVVRTISIPIAILVIFGIVIGNSLKNFHFDFYPTHPI